MFYTPSLVHLRPFPSFLAPFSTIPQHLLTQLVGAQSGALIPVVPEYQLARRPIATTLRATTTRRHSSTRGSRPDRRFRLPRLLPMETFSRRRRRSNGRQPAKGLLGTAIGAPRVAERKEEHSVAASNQIQHDRAQLFHHHRHAHQSGHVPNHNPRHVQAATKSHSHRPQT